MTVATDTAAARALRHSLADRLAAAGHGQRWVDAVRAVPRHLFVPLFHQQDGAGHWSTVTAEHSGYLEGAYADRALTTQLTDGTPTSSSSEPGLMLTMLDALAVRAGLRVLEVGTGTGYNAALLAHVLGDTNVTTVDVDPELTSLAGRRLAATGYRPHVHTGDGAVGVADRAPFDRVIATCGMRSIPWPWIEQAADGAVVVAPLGWGLARITVHDGHAHGRFLPQGTYFMARRTPDAKPRFAELERTAATTTEVAAVEAVERLQFPLALALPGYRSVSWADEKTGGTGRVGIWTADGSTATADSDGRVRQIGPRRLWDVVEELHEQFPTSPAREDFGLTLTAGKQRVWWGTEDGPGWDLPATPFAD
ncbi:methyltransferase domain-containing protein [Kitasatospora sp. YST-16]|uniref:methyltransferase domain-containing protein n=1 Tax=Kitasatospora sp. YST-16 TaxID=2998080 RepID=UPI002284544E|nr:methyltransferase domain-containing protein [Kitasatospora sp. YST-16]WAL73538.1 methyltransferase domain-containing protein [Kitasatospora sp. YST-16]WNW39594.1 methyltransferase domain-containing protein [Streptomyces sp. Li-HN-5-13]